MTFETSYRGRWLLLAAAFFSMIIKPCHADPVWTTALGTLHNTRAYLSFQEVYHSKINWRNQLEFIFDRTLWIESDFKRLDSRNQTRERIQKESLLLDLSLMTLEDRGKDLVEINWITTNINDDNTYQTKRQFNARFIEGNWLDFKNGNHFVLRLTDSSQKQFNMFMKERLNLMIFLEAKNHKRAELAHQNAFIESMRFNDFKVLSNTNAIHYLNENAPTLDIDLRGATYLMGDRNGLICSHPDYEVGYQVGLTENPDLEMKWNILSLGLKLIQPLVPIEF